MTPNPITVSYLIDRITAAVEAHPWFQGNYTGERWDLEENASAYPFAWIAPNLYDPRPQDRVTEYSFLIAALDLVDEEMTAEVDRLSACATAIEDLFNTLAVSIRTGGSNEGEMWRPVRMEGRQKILDGINSHGVVGWQIELFIQAPFNIGSCNTP